MQFFSALLLLFHCLASDSAVRSSGGGVAGGVSIETSNSIVGAKCIGGPERGGGGHTISTVQQTGSRNAIRLAPRLAFNATVRPGAASNGTTALPHFAGGEANSACTIGIRPVVPGEAALHAVACSGDVLPYFPTAPPHTEV